MPVQFETDQPQRILVVEPDPFLLHLSADVLMRQGYEVYAAENAATAWEELLAINYHLLITDYKLPKITGIGLIKKLRTARLALPVVLITEKLSTQLLARLQPLQPAVMLLKPIAADALLDTVKTVLRVAGSPLYNLAARASTITPLLQEILQRGIDCSHLELTE